MTPPKLRFVCLLVSAAAFAQNQTTPATRQTPEVPPAGAAALTAQDAPRPTAETTLLKEAPDACAYKPIDIDNPAYAGQPFQNPPMLYSKNGVLTTKLEVKFTDPSKVKIAGCGVKLRSFNGALGGPTLRLKPGDTLRLLLDNQLPTETPQEIARQFQDEAGVAHIIAKPHSFNTTNMHYHGLHVSPSSKVVDGKVIASDDVLIAVAPGEQQQYEVAIPKDHPTGTFWYHPHAHGSTAVQVGSGMAGALIIDDDPKVLPKSLAQASSPEHEKIMVFESILYNTHGEVTTIASFFPSPNPPTPEACAKPGEDGTWECSHRLTTINGQIVPIITMRPGEVQRWRMVDGGFRESIELQLDNHPLHEIALDGIYTGQIDDWGTATRALDLEPGYRSDVLVQAQPCTPQNPTHREQVAAFLLKSSPAQALPPIGGCVFGLWNRPVAGKALRGIQQREGLLAIVEVKGDPVTDMSLPTVAEMTALRATVNLTVGDISGQATGVQQVVYKLGQDPKGAKNYFQVNYGSYDPDNVRRLQLGKTEQWNITTIGDPANINGIPPLPHVFHIHVNPFQYTRIGSGGQPELVYKDTLFIPAGDGENSINVYTTYTDFTGQFVMHCHILDHEDLGMMEVDEVVKDVITPMKMESADMIQHHHH